MKVFYDHLVMIDELFVEIDVLDIDVSSKKEMKQLIDEIAHHKVMTRILDILPKKHHEEFLTRFYNAPADPGHVKFLQEKIDRDIHYTLAKLSREIKAEILSEIKKHKK